MGGTPLPRLFAAGTSSASVLAALKHFQPLFPDAAIVTRAEHDLNIRCTTRPVFSIGTDIVAIAKNLGRVLALHGRMLVIAQHPDEVFTNATLSRLSRCPALCDDRKANALVALLSHDGTGSDRVTEFLRDRCSIDCAREATERMFSLYRLEQILEGCPHTNLRLEDSRRDSPSFVRSVFQKHPKLGGLSKAPASTAMHNVPTLLQWRAGTRRAGAAGDDAVMHRYSHVFGYAADHATDSQENAGSEDRVRVVVDAINAFRDLLGLPRFTPSSTRVSESGPLIGESYLEEQGGRVNRGAELARAAYDAAPDFTPAKVRLAEAWRRTDREAAIGLLKTAVRNWTQEDEFVAIGLARACERQGLRDEAGAVLAHLGVNLQRHWEVQQLQARLRSADGDLPQATLHARAAWQASPAEPEAAVLYARLLVAGGEPAQATAALLAYLSANGGREETWRLADDPTAPANPAPLLDSFERLPEEASRSLVRGCSMGTAV